jgi:hypothetical protein
LSTVKSALASGGAMALNCIALASLSLAFALTPNDGLSCGKGVGSGLFKKLTPFLENLYIKHIVFLFSLFYPIL